MKILKNLFRVKNNSIFYKNGKFNPTKDNCYLIDCVLLIYASGLDIKTLDILRLELFRGGIFLSSPELKKVILYLIRKGMITPDNSL